MDWKRLKKARRCALCEKGFVEAEEYFTFLVKNAEEFSRDDYCATCYEGLEGQKREESISHWQGRYKPEPEPHKEEPIEKGMIHTLLQKYLGSGEPSHENVCYILALMLERKKKIRARDRITDPDTGKKMIVYEYAASGDTLLLVDPGLDLRQARLVQRQVKELLDSEGVIPHKRRRMRGIQSASGHSEEE